jgi:hypothetical protein
MQRHKINTLRKSASSWSLTRIDVHLQVLKKSRNILSTQGIIRSSRKEIDPLEDLHIGFRIILIQILKE